MFTRPFPSPPSNPHGFHTTPTSACLFPKGLLPLPPKPKPKPTPTPLPTPLHVTTSLVAQREGSVALRHGVAKPGFVLPCSTPNGPVPWKEGGSGAVPWVSTDSSPKSVMMLRSAPRMATSGRLPECSIRLRTSLPHDRPAIRASMSQTSTKGSCHKRVRVGRELLHRTPACGPQTRPPSATAHLGCSRGSTPCDSLGIDDAQHELHD